MGTNNFYNRNASKIFACDLEGDDSYSFLKEGLLESLDKYFINQFCQNDSFDDNNRNYPGIYIGNIDYEYRNCLLRIKPVIRSGYYEGCNLDYEIEYRSEQDFCEDLEDLKNDLEHSKRPFKAVEKSFKKQLKLIVKNLEKVFAENSTALNKVGQFSNGEAIYERSNN